MPYTGDAGYNRELEVEVEVDRPREYTGRFGVPHTELDYAEEWKPPRERGLPVSPLAGAVAAGAAALVGGLVARLVHNRSGNEEMDVEVELEERPAYRPSTSAAATPRRTAATGGEMQVEVELEGRGAQAGYTSSPQPISAEREYEVELERPRDTPSDPPLM